MSTIATRPPEVALVTNGTFSVITNAVHGLVLDVCGLCSRATLCLLSTDSASFRDMSCPQDFCVLELRNQMPVVAGVVSDGPEHLGDCVRMRWFADRILVARRTLAEPYVMSCTLPSLQNPVHIHVRQSADCNLSVWNATLFEPDSPLLPLSDPSSNTSKPSSTSGLGWIVWSAIAISIVVVLLAVAVSVWHFLRVRKRAKAKKEEQQKSTSKTPETVNMPLLQPDPSQQPLAIAPVTSETKPSSSAAKVPSKSESAVQNVDEEEVERRKQEENKKKLAAGIAEMEAEGKRKLLEAKKREKEEMEQIATTFVPPTWDRLHMPPDCDYCLLTAPNGLPRFRLMRFLCFHADGLLAAHGFQIELDHALVVPPQAMEWLRQEVEPRTDDNFLRARAWMVEHAPIFKRPICSDKDVRAYCSMEIPLMYMVAMKFNIYLPELLDGILNGMLHKAGEYFRSTPRDQWRLTEHPLAVLARLHDEGFLPTASTTARTTTEDNTRPPTLD